MAKILVVDDNKDIAALVAENLSNKGLSASFATNGNDVIAMLSNQSGDNQIPFICILDVVMSGLSGVELMDEILSIAPEMRFMLMTGYYNIPEIEDMKKKGIVDIFYKPFNMDELTAKVNFVLSNTQRIPLA